MVNYVSGVAGTLALGFGYRWLYNNDTAGAVATSAIYLTAQTYARFGGSYMTALQAHACILGIASLPKIKEEAERIQIEIHRFVFSL